MREKRIDSMTNDIVIYAKERANRPIDKFDKPKDEAQLLKEYDCRCPFCRGNEESTPIHTYEACDDEGWIVKSTLNKYPIIDTLPPHLYGIHEVMIESYKHNANFYNMNEDEFKEIIKMYLNRYSEILQNDNTKYISVFKNYLNKAGASLLHPHAQIISLPFVPPDIENEMKVAKEYYDKNKTSLYEDTIKKEIEHKNRIVYDGEKILAIIPYATKYSGEIRILFKDKIKFENIDDGYINEISYFLQKLFINIEKERGCIPFNLYIHNNPKNEDCIDYYTPHIHIVPRSFYLGGFELSTGMYATSLVPEDYARKLKI